MMNKVKKIDSCWNWTQGSWLDLASFPGPTQLSISLQYIWKSVFFFVHTQGEPGNEARLDLPVFHHWTYTHQEFITVKLFRKTYFGVLVFSRHHHKPTEKNFLDACNCTAPIIVYCVATVQFSNSKKWLLWFKFVFSGHPSSRANI